MAPPKLWTAAAALTGAAATPVAQDSNADHVGVRIAERRIDVADEDAALILDEGLVARLSATALPQIRTQRSRRFRFT
jgi:hypothetical protein